MVRYIWWLTVPEIADNVRGALERGDSAIRMELSMPGRRFLPKRRQTENFLLF